MLVVTSWFTDCGHFYTQMARVWICLARNP